MRQNTVYSLWPPLLLMLLLWVAGASSALRAQAPPAPSSASVPAAPEMALAPAGVYRPLFRVENEPKTVPVGAFRLDVVPVTNEDYLEFVRANPRWRRSQIKRLFADESYLRHWTNELAFEPSLARLPVTFVSWFSAKAYAQWKGKRLPSMAEWEYAAAASPTRPDGENDPAFQKETLRWYATPTPDVLPAVGRGRANVFGVQDLHGLVWEWVSDFNTAMVTGDARGDTGLERQLFCGAGAQGASDRANYAAFMRYSFRSSLKAGYTVHNLGFRCAKDL
jgi:sulfatase modifying factor 1